MTGKNAYTTNTAQDARKLLKIANMNSHPKLYTHFEMIGMKHILMSRCVHSTTHRWELGLPSELIHWKDVHDVQCTTPSYFSHNLGNGESLAVP